MISIIIFFTLVSDRPTLSIGFSSLLFVGRGTPRARALLLLHAQFGPAGGRVSVGLFLFNQKRGKKLK